MGGLSDLLAYDDFKYKEFHTSLPMEEKVRQRSCKIVTALRPLFPVQFCAAFFLVGEFWRTGNRINGIAQRLIFREEQTVVLQGLVSQPMLYSAGRAKLLQSNLFEPEIEFVL